MGIGWLNLIEIKNIFENSMEGLGNIIDSHLDIPDPEVDDNTMAYWEKINQFIDVNQEMLDLNQALESGSYDTARRIKDEALEKMRTLIGML